MALTCFVLVFTINQATANIVVKDCPENEILFSELTNSNLSAAQKKSLTNCFCKQFTYDKLIVENANGSPTGETCYDYLQDMILKYS